MKKTKKPTAAQQKVIDRINNGYCAICFCTRNVAGYIHAWISRREDGTYRVVETFRTGDYKAIWNAIDNGFIPANVWVNEKEITINWDYSNCVEELHRAGVQGATEYWRG